MNVSELKVKPCPFCGSDDISFSAFSLSPDAYALCVHCNAGIEIQVGWDEMTEKEHDEVCNLELQKVWNRRSVEQPQLNENQQVVLEWLKEQVSIGNDLQYVLWEFTDNVYEEPAEYSVSEQTKAWLELTEQEQFQVLAAFAEWGSKGDNQ